MITLRLEGDSRDAIVRSISELREAMGKRVDFGMPFDRGEIGAKYEGGKRWICDGYQMTVAEFEQCQQSGDWPAIDIFGFVKTQTDGA